MSRLRLKIGPVIKTAEDVRDRVQREIPQHTGLMSLAEAVAAAARDAERVAQRLKRPFGIHRLPLAFLATTLIIFVVWSSSSIYFQFFRTKTLSVAVPDRDAQVIRDRVQRDKIKFELVIVPGSRESVEMVKEGTADLGFVQGGIEIPQNLLRTETPHPEFVLWFVRSRIDDVRKIRRILTSTENAGSHSVSQAFMKAWNVDGQVSYLHDWNRLAREDDYSIPDDIDAAFLVKDPADLQTLRASERLADAGFELRSPHLGARVAQLEYLHPHEISIGYLRSVPPFPGETVSTYSVSTYLIARKGITPKLLATASHLLETPFASLVAGQHEPTLSETSEIFQGVEALLGIVINLVLAFLALAGLEMMAYRKRFHELNSLVSLISIHQSSKDVLGVTDPKIRHNHLLYLSLCSDLLGLISMIGGYYTQENSSLLFSGLPEIVHQRCDGLKINIQLKILHATVGVDATGEAVKSEQSKSEMTANGAGSSSPPKEGKA